MGILDMSIALRCYAGGYNESEASCSRCSHKRFCDDITLLMLKHKKEEEESTNTDAQGKPAK